MLASMASRSPTCTILAFLAAPIFPAIAAGLGTPVTSTFHTPFGLISTDPVSVFGFALIFYIFALPVSAALGIPALALLRRYDLVRWWTAALVGAAIGGLGSLIIVADRVLRTRSFAQDVDALILYGVIGGMSGFVFWLIWRQGSPLPPKASQERTHGD